MSRVLDTLRVEMTRAVATGGADSLRTVARRARQRVEDALPPDRRAPFREWMQAHHARMMEQMGGGMMNPESTGSGMMGPNHMGPGMTMGRDSSGG